MCQGKFHFAAENTVKEFILKIYHSHVNAGWEKKNQTPKLIE